MTTVRGATYAFGIANRAEGLSIILESLSHVSVRRRRQTKYRKGEHRIMEVVPGMITSQSRCLQMPSGVSMVSNVRPGIIPFMSERPCVHKKTFTNNIVPRGFKFSQIREGETFVRPLAVQISFKRKKLMRTNSVNW